ncbi:hypothetical protein BH24GEM2_BH24GEM2_04250 [soil metagenome]|jgi:hypothetical protein
METVTPSVRFRCNRPRKLWFLWLLQMVVDTRFTGRMRALLPHRVSGKAPKSWSAVFPCWWLCCPE